MLNAKRVELIRTSGFTDTYWSRIWRIPRAQIRKARIGEITQLEIAYDALKTQPRDAQLRMLAWLNSRLDHDYEKAMEAKKEALRNRGPSFAVSAPAEPK